MKKLKKEEKSKWRWELEEPKKEIIVPTLREKVELGLTDEEVILICYIQHKNGKCFRERHAHPLCNSCPKFTKIKLGEERRKEIEILLAKIMKKLTRRKHYRKRR